MKYKIDLIEENGLWIVLFNDDHAPISYSLPDFQKATEFAIELSKHLGIPQ
jgi:hypothetical protein